MRREDDDEDDDDEEEDEDEEEEDDEEERGGGGRVGFLWSSRSLGILSLSSGPKKRNVKVSRECPPRRAPVLRARPSISNKRKRCEIADEI